MFREEAPDVLEEKHSPAIDRVNVCGNFATYGECRFGAKCAFKHTRESPRDSDMFISNRSKPCPEWRYFKNCRRGQECPLRHSEPKSDVLKPHTPVKLPELPVGGTGSEKHVRMRKLPKRVNDPYIVAIKNEVVIYDADAHEHLLYDVTTHKKEEYPNIWGEPNRGICMIPFRNKHKHVCILSAGGAFPHIQYVVHDANSKRKWREVLKDPTQIPDFGEGARACHGGGNNKLILFTGGDKSPYNLSVFDILKFRFAYRNRYALPKYEHWCDHTFVRIHTYTYLLFGALTKKWYQMLYNPNNHKCRFVQYKESPRNVIQSSTCPRVIHGRYLVSYVRGSIHCWEVGKLHIRSVGKPLRLPCTIFGTPLVFISTDNLTLHVIGGPNLHYEISVKEDYTQLLTCVVQCVNVKLSVDVWKIVCSFVVNICAIFY